MKKVDDVRCRIVAQQGRLVTLDLLDELSIKDAVQRRYNGRYYAYLTIVDPNSITDLQRKHFYALMGDFAEHTGYTVDASEDYFKFNFMQDYDLDEFPSVARGMMDKTTASKLLEYVITFCVQNDIPFRKQQFYLTTDASKMLFALTMGRLCMVCGKPQSDIHHANAIGMGRDRSRVDHTRHEFMCLCREHHTEIHQIGAQEFMKKYHIKPVKLNSDQLKELGI